MVTYNLGELFERVVDVIADREAIVSGDRRFDFAAVDARTNRLARVLRDAGISAGDRIALMLRNGHEYLEAMLAAFKLRAIPINVNTRYTVDELGYLLDDAGPGVVIHEPDLGEVIDGAVRTARVGAPVRLVRGGHLEGLMASADDRRLHVPGRSGDDRYVLYTGGTTGDPKGVIWRHEDLLFAALGGGNLDGDPIGSPEEIAASARCSRTRILPASPFSHGTAHWSALAALLSGGAVVIDVGSAFDPERLWDLVDRERVRTLVIVGDAFGRPLAGALTAFPDRWQLADLLVISSGGAILSPATRDALLEHLPSVVIVDGYGTSETGGQGTMPVFAGQEAPALPRFHVDAHTAVLDDAGRPAPPGSGLVGRLARRGHIPIGYLGDPAKTAKTFVEIGGTRWSVPGDLARIEADGTVTLLGRGTSSINSGGEKIFPEEVEIVLKAAPGIVDAVVVGVPDERFGERVAAVVEMEEGRSFDRSALVRHGRRHLAAYKVPKTIVSDRVRRRPSGKPDLQWARERLLQIDPTG